MFTPGEMIQFDKHIFQMARNHQLEIMAYRNINLQVTQSDLFIP